MIQLEDHVHGNSRHFTYSTFAQYHFKYFILQFQRVIETNTNLQVYTFAKYAVLEDSAVQSLNRNNDVNILINQRIDSMH